MTSTNTKKHMWTKIKLLPTQSTASHWRLYTELAHNFSMVSEVEYEILGCEVRKTIIEKIFV